MRVLFVLPEFPPQHGGGIVTYYRDLLSGLHGNGVECAVIMGSAYVHGGQAYQWEGIQVDVLRADAMARWMANFQHLALFPNVRRHLASAYALHEQAIAGQGFDAVEVVDWGLLFVPWVIEESCPALVQLHGSCGQIGLHDPVNGGESEHLLALLLERAVLGYANLHAHSIANARWWESLTGRNVYYLAPPFRLPAQHSSLGLTRTEKFLAVGRIQIWKGPQVACAAWQKLGADAPLLEWIGRDVEYGETRQSTSSMLRREYPSVWGGLVRAIGQCAPDLVYGKMQAAKCVVVPSTWDVYNLVTAEAMALGTPVIVSTGAGAAELVEEGRTGFTFESDNPAALAEKVASVARLSAAAADEIGNNARESVRSKLDPTAVAEQKIYAYRRLAPNDPIELNAVLAALRPASCSSRSPLEERAITELASALINRIGMRVYAQFGRLAKTICVRS